MVPFERRDDRLGLDCNELIETPCEELNLDGVVECKERLGGVLKYYRRAA